MENIQKLQKHFATVLRNLASGKENKEVNLKLVTLLNRKDIIAIIERSDTSKKPTAQQLAKLENIELMVFIEHELYILLYLCEQWCKEKNTSKPAPSKIKANEKTDKKSV